MAVIVNGRGFVVLMDVHQNEDGMPSVMAQDVDMTDALMAAAAILAPVLQAQPEVGAKSVRSLVAMADPAVCEGCPHREECEVQGEGEGDAIEAPGGDCVH